VTKKFCIVAAIFIGPLQPASDWCWLKQDAEQ
jgi:hypothetical protein